MPKIPEDIKKLIDQPHYIAGIISSPAQTNMVTKSGKPYGRFIVEDYTGNIEISLFGDSFERYKNILSRKDQYVLMHLTVDRPRWKKDGDFEVKLEHIQLLSEVLENRTKRIDVAIKLHDLSSQMIDDLKTMVLNYVGKTPVYFQVGDELEVVHMESSHIRVNPRDFMMAARKNNDLSIRLVT